VRVVISIILFIVVIAVVTFVLQNAEPVTIRFLGWSREAPMAIVTIGMYLLGMLTGWAVFGLLRRSLRTIRSRDEA